MSPLGWEHSHSWFIIVFPSRMHALYVSEVVVSQLLNCQVKLVHFMFQRKWYRNFLMKGFHLVVLLAAGPGIRDTQVMFFVILTTEFDTCIVALHDFR